jgi:hypothetical protein
MKIHKSLTIITILALVLIYLVITIPFVTANSLKNVLTPDQGLEVVTGKAAASTTGSSGGTNYTSGLPSPTGLPDAAEACVDKKKKGESLVEFLDSGVIRTLTGIVEIMFAICSMYSTVSFFFDISLKIVKAVCAVQTCEEWGPSPMAVICSSVEKVVIAWKTITMPISLICCFVNCGFIPWCSGHSCWDQFGNIAQEAGITPPGETPGVGDRLKAGFFNPVNSENYNSRAGFLKEKEPGFPMGLKGYSDNVKRLHEYYKDKKVTNIAFPEGFGAEALTTLKGHLSANQNIWTAIACLCPTAILINLKKLRTIYQVYNCCIEEACASGGSTESCERALSEQLCMYWEGSLLQTLVDMIIGILTMVLTKLITALIAKYLTFLIPILQCFTALMELLQIPSNIKQLGETWQSLSQSDFNKVSCSDLDQSKVAEFQPNLKDRKASTKIFTFDLSDWQNKKQEAENNAYTAPTISTPFPTPITLDTAPTTAIAERAPITIIFPPSLGTVDKTKDTTAKRIVETPSPSPSPTNPTPTPDSNPPQGGNNGNP